jgi:hypothetical protein
MLFMQNKGRRTTLFLQSDGFFFDVDNPYKMTISGVAGKKIPRRALLNGALYGLILPSLQRLAFFSPCGAVSPHPVLMRWRMDTKIK